MTISAGKQNLLQTVRTKSQVKGDITNEAARAIIRIEAERQSAKTARLREARLAVQSLRIRPGAGPHMPSA